MINSTLKVRLLVVMNCLSSWYMLLRGYRFVKLILSLTRRGHFTLVEQATDLLMQIHLDTDWRLTESSLDTSFAAEYGLTLD